MYHTVCILTSGHETSSLHITISKEIFPTTKHFLASNDETVNFKSNDALRGDCLSSMKRLSVRIKKYLFFLHLQSVLLHLIAMNTLSCTAQLKLLLQQLIICLTYSLCEWIPLAVFALAWDDGTKHGVMAVAQPVCSKWSHCSPPPRTAKTTSVNHANPGIRRDFCRGERW